MPKLALACGWVVLASFATGQDRPKPKVDSKQVTAAVDKAVEWLKTNLNDSSNVELGLLALLHGGAEETVQKRLDEMLDKPLDHTYRVALQAMILSKLDADKYRLRLAQCAQFLADNQCQNGQWDYGKPTKFDHLKDIPHRKGKTGVAVKISKREKGTAFGDFSCSQFAALGLRACADAGFEFEKRVLENAHQAWTRAQNSDGGWDYVGVKPENQRVSYGSMTVGGVGARPVSYHLSTMLNLWCRSKNSLQHSSVSYGYIFSGGKVKMRRTLAG